MNFTKARPKEVDTIVDQISERYGILLTREGIHATDCIYCLRKPFWNRTNPLPPTPTEILYFIRGLGMQDAMLGKGSPSEITHEGITLSPDYYKDGVLVELKTTTIGVKRLDAYDFPEGWVKQLMAYCYVLKLKSAILIVLTLIRSELLSYVLTFEEEELEANWKWVVERAKQLMEAYTINVEPAEATEEENWQCSNCRYALRCLTMKEVTK